MKKICIKCGTTFEAKRPYSDKTLCDVCAKQSLNNTVLREKICIDCGAHFIGYPRSFRCEECRNIRLKEIAKKGRERKKAGLTRQIGSIDHCEKCGKEYVVNGSLQRYCPVCAQIEVKNNERAKSREWARNNFDYQKRQKNREQSIAEIPCVICGKMFKPHGNAKTCSQECSKILRKKDAHDWESSHKTERNAYRKKKRAEKTEANKTTV